MVPDQHPIPREALPPGWGPATHCDAEIVYRRTRPPIELIAAKTDADRSHPALGLERCWELRFHHLIGNFPIRESVGRVSTRSAALDGLLESMHRIHDHVENLENPLEIRRVLEEIPLGDRVPDAPTSLH